jgi:hypothetical protein
MSIHSLFNIEIILTTTLNKFIIIIRKHKKKEKKVNRWKKLLLFQLIQPIVLFYF